MKSGLAFQIVDEEGGWRKRLRGTFQNEVSACGSEAIHGINVTVAHFAMCALLVHDCVGTSFVS